MNKITKENRQAAYIRRPVTRASSILKELGKRKRGMTARQLAYRMGFQDLNAVKPRLTELMQEGLVIAAGKTVDELTNRSVTVWKVVS